MAGHADLAHYHDIERRLQGAGQLVRHGNSAARQRKNDDIVAMFVVRKAAGEKLTGLAAIVESLRVIHLSC